MINSAPSFQFYSFCGALLLYTMFSSPTPDTLGLPEIIIGLLLAAFVRIQVTNQDNKLPFLGLMYGLTLPIIFSIISGFPLLDIIRDIIPFLFLFTVLFYGWGGQSHPIYFIKIVVITGIIFSFRTCLSYHEVLLTPSLWGYGPPADLLYLANSPEVLFSALCCIGYGLKLLMQDNQKLKAIALLGLSAPPLMAMILMSQRAGIGSVILFVTIFLSYTLYTRPKWGLIFIITMALLMIILWPILGQAIEGLWIKTELVGLNSRIEEWATVLKIISKDSITLLFGEGWGARIENPAVGGINVTYTHSFISSLLLKTGAIGTIIILLACLKPVSNALKSVYFDVKGTDFILLGAISFPFLISVFLYASYKSLGFGLILLIFSVLATRKLEKN